MKTFLTLTILLGSFASHARIPVELRDAMSTGVVTSAPVFAPIFSTTCHNEDCYGIFVALPLSTVEAVTTTLVVALKEEVNQAEPDAYDFLAGGEMTLTLADLLTELRTRHPELNEVNDQDLVTFMLKNKLN